MDIPRKVLVKNTWVELTPEQIKFVEESECAREKEIKKVSSSLVNVLHHFGFKKAATVEGGYGNDKYQWWAEIIQHGNQEPYVWIVGNNLRDSPFPGGWTYWEPQDLFRALGEALLKS